jgi:tetratricopeptide (TPR) repeat protein
MSDVPEPSRLARFLASRGRKIDEAAAIAERVAADRRDIFTEDALAWAYFQSGRLDQARAAAALAMRTGTRDRTIRYHAAAIARASGQAADARRLASDALKGSPHFDPIDAPAAAALLKSLDAAAQPR